MSVTHRVEEAVKAPFGTVFAEKISVSEFKDGAWSPLRIEPIQPLKIFPYSHVLHYGSSCFEGMKAYRWSDDSIHTFRLSDHARRLQNSADMLCLPVPGQELIEDMIRANIRACADWVPESPGSLYIRPTLVGTLASIGAAAHPSSEALFFVLLSPVGDYFKGGARPLRIVIEDQVMRTSPDFGTAKAGGNYASALKPIMKARKDFAADQVLFAPGGDVQETGAANFILISDKEVVTKDLDSSFLHGITRNSLLKIAADLGYKVSERRISVEEVLEWSKNGEAALSGSAAVLAGIGELIYQGETFQVGSGQIGENTLKLRNALVDVQTGRVKDRYGWTAEV